MNWFVKQGPIKGCQEVWDNEGAVIAQLIPTPEIATRMAAAPELLAALKELVHYDEGSSEQGSYGYEVLLRCKAAIAKAEGRSE